jgi:hypothetical protein
LRKKSRGESTHPNESLAREQHGDFQTQGERRPERPKDVLVRVSLGKENHGHHLQRDKDRGGLAQALHPRARARGSESPRTVEGGEKRQYKSGQNKHVRKYKPAISLDWAVNAAFIHE